MLIQSKDDRVNFEHHKKNFSKLKKEGNLGFYKRCEIVSIFIINTDNDKIFNYFTIVCFEEKIMLGNNDMEYLLESPKKVNEKYKLGICRYYLKISEVNESFTKLLESNKWIHEDYELNFFNKLRPIPKQFIPANSSDKVFLNYILKNNFFNGSYIIEFFDEEKNILNNFSSEEIDFINRKIISVINIDLKTVNDRIGNFIFQFPSTLLQTNISSLEDWNGINLDLVWHPSLEKDIPEYNISTSNSLDDVLIGFNNVEGKEKNHYEINSGNTHSKNHLMIYNPETKLIYSYFKGGFIEEINTDLNMSGKYDEPRTIENEDNSIEEIKLVSDIDISRRNSKDYIDHVRYRMRDNELLKLERQKKIIQYCMEDRNERDKALTDLREIINRFCEIGVYLWDPYLRYRDILDTVYYLKKSNTPIKVITSFTTKTKDNLESDKDYNDYDKFVECQKNGFMENSNNKDIDIEIRCRHDNYGWDFHDRFLIFPAGAESKSPRAWSLGTSVNGFGRSGHHILQEVPNPRLIQDAFENLWSFLEESSCVLWRRK